MGQALSRLADWQADMLADALTRPGRTGAGRAPGRGRRGRAALLPRMREIQSYVWRRHLAANADRLLAAAGPGDRRELAVGFADLVGYTSRSRGMGAGAGRDDRGLREHRRRGDRPARGRVVKTVGDGVLFTARAPWPRSDRARAARGVGLRGPPTAARGCRLRPVLTRLGDVYSPVVNLASRLTSLARPGTMLVDRELAERLRERTPAIGCAR